MHLSNHFKSSEIACKHCGDTKTDLALVILLELIRERFKAPVIITSGYRCETHNANVGGAPKSKHVQGIAADIKVKGVEPKEVYDYLDNLFPNSLGLGLYSTWVHVDTRDGKGRW